MHDPLNEEYFSLDERSSETGEPPRRGGPSTPEGKANSSQNRLRHGCRSDKTILRDEDPEEFEFNMKWWYDFYQPEDPILYLLVEQAARAYWFLKRNEKHLEEVEYNLPTLRHCWTPDNHKELSNFIRYKTTAERTFFRCFKELEAYCGRQSRAEQLQERARDTLMKLQFQWIDEKRKNKLDDSMKVTQLVEVEVRDGKAKTTYYPTNQQLIQDVAKRPAPPMLIERYVRFQDGVPPEYNWTRASDFQKETDTLGIQKLNYNDWLNLIQQERATGTGHIGPIIPISPPLSQPRPSEPPLSEPRTK